jgi:hypothetical protein
VIDDGNKPPFDVSKLYKLGAKEEPPIELDKQILAQAQTHLETRQEQTFSSRESQTPLWVRWKEGLVGQWQWSISVAAVVVISSSIVLDLHKQNELMVLPESTYELSTEPMFVPEEKAEEKAEESVIKERVLEEKMLRKERTAEDSQKALFLDAEPQSAFSNDIETERLSVPEMPTAPQAVSPQTISPQSVAPQGISSKTVERSYFKKSAPKAKAIQPATTASESVKSVDVWLAEINALVDAGKLDQARDELKAFREKYPEYRLAPELEMLLN